MLTKVKAKWRETAVSHFITELIDYAGLFPPAALPLPEAIRNYSSYISRSDSWMLGPFVIPAARLNELAEYKDRFNEQYPLRLSVILTESNELQTQLRSIEQFLHTYQDVGSVDSIEIKLSHDVKPSFLEKLAKDTIDYPIYCEVSGTNEQIKALLDTIKSVNHKSPKQIGVKMRMGGIKADLFPSAEKAAFVIHECQGRDLFIKFTAGLHHPIRQYRNEVETKMHGFVNVFTAALFAYNDSIDVKTIETILLDEDPSHFSFTPAGLSWGNMSVSSEEINKARSLFAHSYGSCSFDEPREELGNLSIFHEEETE
ncbi:hypothetical protein R4Z09_28015 [Niallia oryzisoli]|uniref:Uncharacterized protein n=1 Tax=Niallia oryzisoli TaxID=1737571 RepID=A0ABZ2CBA0_9BACI